MFKKTILLVHAGNEGKLFILQKMKQLGLRVVCLNREKNPLAAPYVDHWIMADLNNHKESVAAVKSFIANHPNFTIDGALTFWEEAVLLTSKITDTFNWIGIPYAIAKKAKNKFLFREFCNQNGIPTPKFKLFSGTKDISQIEKHIHYPLVMKPIYGAASFFVVKVENRKEVEETYEYIKNTIKSNWLAQEWENLDLLTEEYIDGDEVDVDIIIQNGKIKFHTISDNFNKNREKFFIDSGQAIPSGLPEKDQKALIDLAEEILEKLGIQNAIIHFEAKVSKGKVYPIEVNLRMGGDYIYSYLKGAWGIDFVEYAVKIALGEYIKIDKPTEPLKYIVGWDLHPDSSGVVVELDINPELAKKKYVEEMHFFKEIGDTILMPPEGYDSLGWITVSGDNLLDAQDNLREALESISFKIVKLSARESTMGKTARRNPFSAAVVKDTLVQAAKIEKVRHIGRGQQRRLHVGIVGNSSTKDRAEGEALIIQKELEQRGYQTTFFDLNYVFRALSNLQYDPVDIIFNATEELNGNSGLQSQATALLEALQIPYTGSSSLTLALCQDKIKTKKFLTYHSIPTPRWDYAYLPEHTINSELTYPLIIKPGVRDSNYNASKISILKRKEQLSAKLHELLAEHEEPALVEEYIEGKEYEVIIIGNAHQDIKVLPLIRYSWGTTAAKIITSEDLVHKSKNLKVECPPSRIDQKLEALITEIALDSYYIMRCRDYGTVRIRVDEDDNPYVIGVEANPSITAYSSVMRTAKAMKMDFGDLLEEIIHTAIERYKHKSSLLI